MFMTRRFNINVDDKSKAAGILPIAIDSGRMLMGLRHDGTYSTIGGFLCWGEKFREGAIREFVEETLYEGPLLLLKGYTYQSPVKDFRYVNYLGICPTEFEPQLDEENVEAEWFTLSQLYAGGLPLKKEFEDFLFESKPMIDSLMENFGVLNP